MTPTDRISLALACVALLAGGSARAAEPGAPPLRVVICDSHHHVLRHWVEAAEAGLLPAKGTSVIHFDAHPDLALPKAPPSRALRGRPGALVSGVDIASFQLAAVWIGLVDRVVWLRPSWATQLPDGRRSVQLGLDAGGRLRVDYPADYYVLDDGWTPAAELRDPVPLIIEVVPFSDAGSARLHAGAAILDVDLDGFATRNPAADRLRDAGFSDPDLERLRRTFARERLDLPPDPIARADALRGLLADLEAVASDDTLEQLAGAFGLWRRGVAPEDLWFTYGLLTDPELRLPTSVLLESGRDLVGLPERAANPAEIRATAAHLAALLAHGAVQPSLVTIARSVRDGYTPAAAWPAIERTLLEHLAGAGRPLDVRYDRGLVPVRPERGRD